MDAGRLKKLMEKAVPDWNRVQEIRIRAGKTIMVWMDGREWWLLENGELLEALNAGKQDAGKRTAVAGKELMKELLEIFTRHSLYAYEEEIRQGYLTMEGGHRVGISGKVVLDGENVKGIKEVSGLNIRLAHEMIGCADEILPWIYEKGSVKNTLLLSPPGGGKTTMLRDLIRQVSDGNPNGTGVFVSVVDERSEIGACFQGVPQCDLGMRTDVMDGCPKVRGMLMMIRSMAPRVLAVDEIGTKEDLEAVEAVMNCGCRILATVHGSSVGDLRQKPVLKQMIHNRMFERYVVLDKKPHPGRLVGIYDENLAGLKEESQKLYGGGA